MVQFAKLLRNKNKRVDKIIEFNYTRYTSLITYCMQMIYILFEKECSEMSNTIAMYQVSAGAHQHEISKRK